MTTRKQKKLDPSSVYVCSRAFVGADGFCVAQGTRLRGNHDAVQRYPQHFAADGTPPAEWPNPYAGITYADAGPPPARPEDDIPADQQVRARDTFMVTLDGRSHTIGRNRILDRNNKLVRRFPDRFETVPQPLEAA